MSIIFLGTSSGAGKTTMSAMFCRYLRGIGREVCPFKASNLSLNSVSTPDGREIGTGQAFQALASGIDPVSDMNPILLKPSGGRTQLVLNGIPAGDRTERPDTDALVRTALEAYDRLSSRYEMVCEGSGSPAELNLMGTDIANLIFPRERDVPGVLVGDIDRGGVFAGIYGTWRLMPEANRRLLKGFVINRFRGDASILRKGVDRICGSTGMEFLGVMPMTDLRFPEEDSMTFGRGRLEGEDLRGAYIRNLDEFLSVAGEHLDLEAMARISSS